MRVALHSRLRSGHETAYEADHVRIPDDLAVEFARVGIHDWTIWRSGRDLFHLVECDDFTGAMDELDRSEANARWQAFIGRHIDGFERFGEDGGHPVPEVWSLGMQQDGPGAS